MPVYLLLKGGNPYSRTTFFFIWDHVVCVNVLLSSNIRPTTCLILAHTLITAEIPNWYNIPSYGDVMLGSG